MPNTLCHIGVQASLGNLLIQPKELPWIIVGCIIPDLPWIFLKILLPTGLFNPYDLRLYCTAQASLFFCLFLAGGLACFSSRRFRTFLIISANCLVHLLLDALQIKWGNGVHIISPLHWQLFHLDLVWPEHIIFLAGTVLGGLFFLMYWKKIANSGFNVLTETKTLGFGGAFLIVLYLTGPILAMDELERNDVYYLKTMREKNNRPGKNIQFDRAHYFADLGELRTWSGEHIKVVGARPAFSGRVSFKGSFLSSDTIKSVQYHYHRDFRDIASMIGLIMSCTLVIHSLFLTRFRLKTKQ